MNIKEITDILDNKQYITPDEIRNTFLSLKKHIVIPNLILSKGNILYRATIINDVSELTNIKRLSYAPAEFNTNYKRASTPNNTMFYAISGDNYSDCITGCLFEVCECFRIPNATHKHYNVAIGVWETTADIKLPQIINPDGKNKSDAFGNTPEFNTILDSVGNESIYIRQFWRYMNKQFTKNVKNENEYWISAVFTEWLVNTLNYKGVIYESVQSTDSKQKNNHCIALTPYAADNFLLFKEAHLFEFDYSGKDVSINQSQKLNLK